MECLPNPGLPSPRDEDFLEEKNQTAICDHHHCRFAAGGFSNFHKIGTGKSAAEDYGVSRRRPRRMFRTHILPLNATVGARSALGTTSHCRTEESWQNQLILDRTENVMSEIEEKRNVTSPPPLPIIKSPLLVNFIVVGRTRKNKRRKERGRERRSSSFFLRPFSGISHTNFPPWHIPPRTYSYLWLSLLHIRIVLPL